MQFSTKDLADLIVCSLDNEMAGDDLDEMVKMIATYRGDQVLVIAESLDSPASRTFRVEVTEEAA